MFKRKSLVERWDDNYAGIPVPANNKKGFKVKYVYYGPWYYWNMEEKDLKKEKMIIAGLSISGMILYFIFALLHSPLNSKMFVVLPGMTAEALHLLELVADIRFLTVPYRADRMTFEDVDNNYRLFPKIRAYLLAAAAGFGVIYLPFKCFSVLSILVILANALCAYMAWYMFKRYGKLTSRIEKNTTLETMERLDIPEFGEPILPDFVRLAEESKKDKSASLPDFVKNAEEKKAAERSDTK